MQITDVLYEILLTPREGMQKLRALNRSWFISLFIVLAAVFSQTLAGFILKPPDSDSLLFFLTFGLLGEFIVVVAGWMFITAIFHFLASWSRGTATSARELFVLLGWSFLPFTLLPAGAILARAFGSIGYSVYIIFYLVILVWFVRLQVLAIKELYTLSGEKAFLVYLAPAIILSLIMLILLFASIGTIIFLIASKL